jgi:hypothetical protein
MTLKFTLRGLAVAATAIAIVAMTTASADAQNRRARSDGANYSYMESPGTRVYVTKRSWLDLGTEVLPGDRKYTDYAIPPGTLNSSYYNSTRPPGLAGPRQPLNHPLDMGGYPSGIPFW